MFKRYGELLSWVSAGGDERAFASKKLNLEPKMSIKSEVSILIPINRFNSCSNIFFTGMALTLHKSQLHCSWVM